jgi:phospholipid-binding lipoprotein MlaA
MTRPDASGSPRARSRRIPNGVLLLVLLAFALPWVATAEPRPEVPYVLPEPGPPSEAACDESVGMDEKPPAATDSPEVLPAEGAAPGDGADRDADLEALSSELEASRAGDSDPLEPLNRHILTFNHGVDAVLLDPLTEAYAFLVPELARQSVRNAFANLNAPVILVNDLLQLEGRDAFVTTARFVINTTMGMGGLFDAAATMGLEPHVSNFSETLSTAGVPMGPYLVLPLLGPTTVRDGFGTVVDLAMSPQVYILPVTSVMLVAGGDGFSLRERHADDLAALRESSVDYYAALRSAYLDRRR